MWLPSLPLLPCVRTPGGCPVGACTARASYGHGRVVRPAPSLRCLPTLPLCLRGGGALSAPSYLHPPPLGGRRCVGGGGGGVVVLSWLHACRRQDASTAQAQGAAPVSLQGGGHALWLPSSPFLPCVRTPGGPPAGACTACALYGHGRVVRPAASRGCLPDLPLCPRGGALFAPPYLHPQPLRGRGCVSGGGRPCRLPFLARTSQARRKHGAGTRRGTCPSAGGGGGLPCVTHRRPSYPACAAPGGRRCVGGGGALVVVPSLHACRRLDASTTQARGQALGCSGGGGFLLWASPPFSMV